jgi:hypothetical protein
MLRLSVNGKKNVLIIGAGGGVGRAFLHRIAGDRSRMGKLVLVDRDDDLPDDAHIPHDLLEYEFVRMNVDEREDRASYEALLHRHGIHIVIDLSVNETRSVLQVTDDSGISYVNTGIANRVGENFYEVVLDVVERSESHPWKAPHILCAGMNPGIVNMWVRGGMERFGVPGHIVHFEYDRGQPRGGWRPIITWSKETFVDEVSNDPAGCMEGRGRVKYFYPNPLKNRTAMKEVLRPIMDLEAYPKGFLLLHEENITIAQTYDVPSRFLFAIHPMTMDYLETVYEERGGIPVEAMTLGDNRKVPLEGAVTIGVLLDYGDRKVYFFNTTRHDSRPGISGSCWQVAAGLHAALFTLVDHPLGNRIHFVEDLFGTVCEKLVADNLPVQEVTVPQDDRAAANL